MIVSSKGLLGGVVKGKREGKICGVGDPTCVCRKGTFVSALMHHPLLMVVVL